METPSSDCSKKGDANGMLWEVDVLPADGRPDRAAERLVDAAAHAGFTGLTVATAVGYLVEGDALDEAAAHRIADGVFTDSVVEFRRVGKVGRRTEQRGEIRGEFNGLAHAGYGGHEQHDALVKEIGGGVQGVVQPVKQVAGVEYRRDADEMGFPA